MTARPLTRGPVTTRAVLVSDLRDLGIARGDVVLFHSSLKSIGWVEPGPEAVVEALLDVVGPEGTIVAPTLVQVLWGPKPLFSAQDSPSDVGLLSEIVRTWPGAQRSESPSHAVSAIGRLAETITAGHDQAWGPDTPFGTKALGFGTPWDKLSALNAWVLLIGVAFNRCTLLHHVQVRWVAKHQGMTAETPWPWFDFARQGDRLEAAGIVRRGRLGQADCRLARAAAIVEHTLATLEQRPREIFAPQGPVAAWLDTCEQLARAGRPRAAAFKVDITPPSPARPVARPLHARGLLLDHPQQGRVALVVCDCYGFLQGAAATVRHAVANAAGVPFASVLVTCTHNHSSGLDASDAGAEYVARVAARVAEAAAEAVGRLEAVRAGWTSVPATGISRNRTVYLRDGRASTEHWEIPSAWFVPPADVLRRGPADDDVRLLVLERLDRTRLAVVADFSCHNSAGMDDPAIHDDFFGIAMELVEQAEGHACVVLGTPGSEGDQEPLALIKLGAKRDLAHATKLGRRLGSAILGGIQGVETRDIFAVAAASETVVVTARPDWCAAAAAQHPCAEVRCWAQSGQVHADVVAAAIGDFAIVGVPAELFTEPARRIREHAPFPHVAVAGLTNGNLMYVADREAYFEGSLIYGVMPQPEAMAAPGTDRALAEAALQALRAARSAQSATPSSTGRG